jgi:hypothetical protein
VAGAASDEPAVAMVSPWRYVSVPVSDYQSMFWDYIGIITIAGMRVHYLETVSYYVRCSFRYRPASQGGPRMRIQYIWRDETHHWIQPKFRIQFTAKTWWDQPGYAGLFFTMTSNVVYQYYRYGW